MRIHYSAIHDPPRPPSRHGAARQMVTDWLYDAASGAQAKRACRPISRDMVNRQRLRNVGRRANSPAARIAASVSPTMRAMSPKPIRPAEKRRDGDLVGGVEGGRRAAARAQRVNRQAERGKTREVRALEGQSAERGRSGGAPPKRSGPDRPRQWAIGVRMSGTPGRRSAIRRRRRSSPWTIDCGCTTTSSRSAGRPNRWCASISSSPLFIRPAELIVTFGPIAQLG